MTFYDFLGVPPDASQEEIRSAYRALARRNHPDSQQGADPETRKIAEENIKAINAAYHALSDPVRRRDYHRVMWTRVDPARSYRYRPLGAQPSGSTLPKTGAPAQPGAPPRTPASSSIYLEILQTREEREQTIKRQQRKRSRLWMSVGFTSLLVYFFMLFGMQLYPSPADLLPLMLYFAGAELITLSIILVASGMRFGSGHPLGEPASLSLMMFLGTLVTCSSAVRSQMLLARPSGAHFGLMISTALLVHLLLSTRLGRLQEVLFQAEIRRLDEHLKDLERKLHASKKKHPSKE